MDKAVWLILVSLLAVCQAQETGGSLPWYVWLILAVGLAVAIVLIGLTGFYVLNVCKKVFGNRPIIYEQQESTPPQRKSKVDNTDNGPATDEVNPSSVSITQHEKEISRESIKVCQQLGIGEYGPLLDAEVQLEVNVKSRALVKVFQKGTNQDLVLYKRELESLGRLNHSNVAQMFGVVSQLPYYTVLELPVNGDLKTFLLTSQSSQTCLTIAQLLAMATDAASGLAYMESIQYIHQDVAARNCVVTQSLGVKIADYKVSRFLFRSEYAVQADGSLMAIRWMAPESLLENHFSLQSDTWSFGILLWEILTKGQFPFAELSDAEVVQRVCYEFQRLLQPVSCPDEIYQLMLKCWHSNPAQRPRMEYLQRQLENCIVRGASTEIHVPFTEESAHVTDDPGIPANHLF